MIHITDTVIMIIMTRRAIVPINMEIIKTSSSTELVAAEIESGSISVALS